MKTGLAKFGKDNDNKALLLLNLAWVGGSGMYIVI